MSNFRSGLSNLDSLTDHLPGPLAEGLLIPQAPRFLGQANEIQLAAFRSPGTWQQHLEQKVAGSTEGNIESILLQILSVVDSLRGTIATQKQLSQTPTTDSISKISETLSSLEAILSAAGVVEFNPISLPVDSLQHEVAFTEPSSDLPPNCVKSVMLRGARRDGKLLRRALVIASCTATAK